jgi:hypothetical protein
MLICGASAAIGPGCLSAFLNERVLQTPAAAISMVPATNALHSSPAGLRQSPLRQTAATGFSKHICQWPEYRRGSSLSARELPYSSSARSGRLPALLRNCKSGSGPLAIRTIQDVSGRIVGIGIARGCANWRCFPQGSGDIWGLGHHVHDPARNQTALRFSSVKAKPCGCALRAQP